MKSQNRIIKPKDKNNSSLYFHFFSLALTTDHSEQGLESRHFSTLYSSNCLKTSLNSFWNKLHSFNWPQSTITVSGKTFKANLEWDISSYQKPRVRECDHQYLTFQTMLFIRCVSIWTMTACKNHKEVLLERGPASRECGLLWFVCTGNLKVCLNTGVSSTFIVRTHFKMGVLYIASPWQQ